MRLALNAMDRLPESVVRAGFSGYGGRKSSLGDLARKCFGVRLRRYFNNDRRARDTTLDQVFRLRQGIAAPLTYDAYEVDRMCEDLAVPVEPDRDSQHERHLPRAATGWDTAGESTPDSAMRPTLGACVIVALSDSGSPTEVPRFSDKAAGSLATHI